MKLLELIRHSQARLEAAGVDNPKLDARLLIAATLHCSRAALISQDDREVTADEMLLVDERINRRVAREPVGRILGEREFWGLPIGLNEATLEPRPDSETLVKMVLDTMHDGYYSHVDARHLGAYHVLDLGTGSGCLLLAILSEWPDAFGTGIDRSAKALEQATLNAQALKMGDRVKFKRANWLSGMTGRVDVVVCNPPYICSDVIETLDPEVKLYDPVTALDGGTDGLAPYHQIIPLLPHYINQGGAAFFEVGKGQAREVASIMEGAGFKQVKIKKDMNNIERCVGGLSTSTID